MARDDGSSGLRVRLEEPLENLLTQDGLARLGAIMAVDGEGGCAGSSPWTRCDGRCRRRRERPCAISSATASGSLSNRIAVMRSTLPARELKSASRNGIALARPPGAVRCLAVGLDDQALPLPDEIAHVALDAVR